MTETKSNLKDLLDDNKEVYRIDYLFNNKLRAMHIIENKDELDAKLLNSGFTSFNKLSIEKDFERSICRSDYQWIDNFAVSDLHRSCVDGYRLTSVKLRVSDIQLVSEINS
ncbi:hypothetical protein [Lactobacillus taiwanensis]|uniref:hypothetical protein n=1 Tax=Lactobacillus taiwanensis TaxID=508451 RepID=UPI00248AF078|nr:hypothetical protein [Lactobacillus taiwanensis]